MQTRTTLQHIDSPNILSYQSNILTLGSCFATNIHKHLRHLGYNSHSNPCGICFNSASLASTIKRLKSPDSLLNSELHQVQGVWSHPDFHSDFNHTNPSFFRDNAVAALQSAKTFIKQVDVVILTIGTSWVYEDQNTGLIVNNCHKRPSSDFKRRMLSKDEISKNLTDIMGEVTQLSQRKVNFIITLSPVRHIRNGLVDDKWSKANALVAIREFVANNTACIYFPSYEILLDDLRDYRYYAEDMIHPTKQAQEYIFEKFEQHFCRAEEKPLRQKIKKIRLKQAHRTRFPDLEASKKFQAHLFEEIEALHSQYPEIRL